MKKSEVERRKKNLMVANLSFSILPLTMATIFYYMIAILFSNLFLGGLNIYISGILAGLTGGLWSYGMVKIFGKLDKIKELKDSKILSDSYDKTLRFFGLKIIIYLVIITIFAVIIKIFRIY